MEGRRWEQIVEAVTHLITSPTATPSVHSQWFIATQIPCYLHWDYPPILCHCKSLHLKWTLSIFFSRFTLPPTSWRSKCPYLQPPPVVLAKGVTEADDRRREYVRKRLCGRRRLGSDVHPLLPIVLPNLLLLSLLLVNPFPIQEDYS